MGNTRFILVLSILLFLSSVASAHWWDSDWDYKQLLTLNTDGIGMSADVDDNHAILVHITLANSDFWSNVDSTGKDVRFVNAAEDAELDFNFESWDYAGNDANMWVKYVDTFTYSADANMYLYYGNSGASDGQDGTGTYPGDYNAVWHLSESSGSATAEDGTGTYNLTHNNTPTTGTGGKIGKGVYYSQADTETSTHATLLDGTVGDMAISMWFKLANTRDSGDSGSEGIGYKYNTNTPPDNHPYRLRFEANVGSFQFGVKKNNSAAFISSSQVSWTAGTWYHLIATRDASTGNMWLFVDGSEDASGSNEAGDVGAGTDTDFTIGRGAGGGEDITLDEIRLYNFVIDSNAALLLYNSENDSLITFGAEEVPIGVTADFNYTTPSLLDSEEGITSVTVDLNDISTYDSTTPVSWQWDENGATFSTDQNTTRAFTTADDYNICLYVVAEDVDLNTYSDQECKTITISQAPQGTDFTWEIDTYSNSDVNVQFNGSTTATGDFNYWWFYNDSNYFSTDENASVAFYTYGDMNVCFVAGSDDVNKQTCKVFDSTVVTIQIPKDEKTDISLTPFHLQVFTTPQQTYDALVADTNFFIFNYAQDYYTFIIDLNSEYYERAFNIYSDGGYHIIQPYLVSTDDGTSTTVYTKYYSNFTTYPGVRVESYKDIGGEETLIESVITDVKGESLMSFIVNDIYTIKAYVGAELMATETLTATSTSLYIYLDVKEIIWGIPSAAEIVIKFNPIGGRVYSSTTLRQAITIEGCTATMIRIVISNKDTNIYDTNWTTEIESGFTNAILVSGLSYDANYALEMTVYVHLLGDNVFIRKAYYSLPLGKDIWALFRGIRTDFGCSTDVDEPCFFLLFLSLFISVAVCGTVVLGTPFGGVNGVLALFLGVMGLFVLFGWVPILLYGLMFLGGTAALVYKMGGGA